MAYRDATSIGVGLGCGNHRRKIRLGGVEAEIQMEIDIDVVLPCEIEDASHMLFRAGIGVGASANEVRAGLNLPPLPDGNVLQNPYTTTDQDTEDRGNADE